MYLKFNYWNKIKSQYIYWNKWK